MKKLFYLLPCLLILACSSGDQGSKSDVTTEESASEAPAMAEAPATAETPEIQDMVVELATRNVKCGCAIEEIGHCGNYVEINSQYVELANSEDVGLGGMEWCGKSGVKVETAGEIKNGKFVASVLTTK
ncbi:MAG: hypothetical protein PVF33_10180 [Candidatus Latescibacterota bacterium]|jgi:hypothetical protein